MISTIILAFHLIFQVASSGNAYHPCDYCGGYWEKSYLAHYESVPLKDKTGIINKYFERRGYSWFMSEADFHIKRTGLAVEKKEFTFCLTCLIRALDFAIKESNPATRKGRE